MGRFICQVEQVALPVRTLIAALTLVSAAQAFAQDTSGGESTKTSQPFAYQSGGFLQEPGTGTGGAGNASAGATSGQLGLAGNPGAVNIQVGNGRLGRLLGIDKDSGFRFGGLWIGDASGVLSGGLDGGQWGLNSLTIVDLFLDTEKQWGWKGTLVRHPVPPVHRPADQHPGRQRAGVRWSARPAAPEPLGALSALVSPGPVRRQAHHPRRQVGADVRLQQRAGPVPVVDTAYTIPAVSGLIYTPIFVNPTMLGRHSGLLQLGDRRGRQLGARIRILRQLRLLRRQRAREA